MTTMQRGISKDAKLILELKKVPADFQQFMGKFVDTIVQQKSVERGTEISTIEIEPRTDRSAKFQITPSPVETFYTISFDDRDSGFGVFLDVEINATGAYKLAKGKIKKVVSERVTENTIKVLNEISE